jgi:NADH-quinone oxidoreductase subunit G
MEGYAGDTPAALLPRVWAPGWNSNEAINQFQIEVGGPLHGGDPGRRIFGALPAAAGAGGDGDRAPAAPAGAPDELLVCAQAEIFGSEAMSRRATALAELAPDNYVRLHPQRAAALGVAHGQVHRVTLRGAGIEATFEAGIELDDTLPSHVALVPAGYPATRWWQRPLWLRMSVAEATP